MGLPMVPRLDGRAAAEGERRRQAKRLVNETLAAAKDLQQRKPKAESKPSDNNKTHRDVFTQRQQQAKVSSDWAAKLQSAVMDAIDNGIPDNELEASVLRILELQEQAKEEEAEAQAALEARAALAVTPVKTPVTKAGSKAAKRAATAGRIPLGEGSIVQLKDLEGVCGLKVGCFDVALEQYNGRKGRVSKEPPPWCIKAVGRVGEEGKPLHDSGGLVPVLLDSRSSDPDRHKGVWLAVPPANLKVLANK